MVIWSLYVPVLTIAGMPTRLPVWDTLDKYGVDTYAKHGDAAFYAYTGMPRQAPPPSLSRSGQLVGCRVGNFGWDIRYG